MVPLMSDAARLTALEQRVQVLETRMNGDVCQAPTLSIEMRLASLDARLRRLEQVALDEVCGPPAWMRRILTAVEVEFGIAQIDMLRYARSRPIANARMAAMFIARSQTGMSFTSIARALGRDHTTVIHGCDAAEQRASEDLDFADRLGRAIARFVALSATSARRPRGLTRTRPQEALSHV